MIMLRLISDANRGGIFECDSAKRFLEAIRQKFKESIKLKSKP